MEYEQDWLIEFRKNYDYNRAVYADVRQFWGEMLGAKDGKEDRRRDLLAKWGNAIASQSQELIEFAKGLPREPQAKLLLLSESVRKGEDVAKELCEVAALLAPVAGATYLGDGRLEINGTIKFITAENDKLFIETLLSNGGAALGSTLEKAGVSNPSVTAKRLRELEDDILAGYIETPAGKKGTGYRTTIADGRK